MMTAVSTWRCVETPATQTLTMSPKNPTSALLRIRNGVPRPPNARHCHAEAPARRTRRQKTASQKAGVPGAVKTGGRKKTGASAGAQKKIVTGKEGVKIRHTIEWRGRWKAKSRLLKFVMEKKAMKSFCSNEDAARWAAVLNDKERRKDDREDIFTQENIKVKMQNLRQHQKMGAHNKTPR